MAKNREKARRIFSVILTVILLSESMVFPGFAVGARSAYDIISDTVYCYKVKGESSYTEIQNLLTELKSLDPQLGQAWSDVINYWIFLNNDLELSYDGLPDGLPKDDSMCIVVLGYELAPDGSMKEELEGRCAVALACAEQYPDAYIVVTGGGTAALNREATEAESMAQWLITHGVREERIIVENQSQTTMENARFTWKILQEKYPQVKYVSIVTSDYHVLLGSLLFREEFILEAFLNNTEPIWLAANAAFRANGIFTATPSIKSQAQELWMLADILDEVY